VLGKEYPSTLTSANNLALVLSRQGNYDQADEIKNFAQSFALYDAIGFVFEARNDGTLMASV
jgi:hypothetical protein